MGPGDLTAITHFLLQGVPCSFGDEGSFHLGERSEQSEKETANGVFSADFPPFFLAILSEVPVFQNAGGSFCDPFTLSLV